MDYLVKQDIVQYPKERLDMSRFVRERVDYFVEVAVQRAIMIETDITAGVSLDFNKTKLQRIVDNTLSNAIKYSHEESEIEVGLSYHDNEIAFWVKDHGVGIENPQKILTRYYREDEDKGGFGIGLNIVKKIIDEHGIVLQIDSRIGEGSTFRYLFKVLY
jgi:signal transduction histidine kinase